MAATEQMTAQQPCTFLRLAPFTPGSPAVCMQGLDRVHVCVAAIAAHVQTRGSFSFMFLPGTWGGFAKASRACPAHPGGILSCILVIAW
jgi:hypothetical protein